MRVAITGGTGFIGEGLTHALADRGDDVIVLTREERPGNERVRYVRWTPEEAGPWTSELEGADAVVHLAGASVLDERWTPERLVELERSRVVPGRIIAEKIASLDKKPRVYVSGSAVGYYGMREDAEQCTESHPPGDDPLARICVAWEKSADPARAAGVRVVHPRIGLVVGRKGGFLSKMLPAFKAFCGGPVGTGEQYLSWIHLEDTVRALLFAVDGDLDGPINVVAPEPVTMNEFARALGCALGRPSFMRVPAFACKLALGERSRAVLTGQRALPARLDDAKFAFLYPELGGALADVVEPVSQAV